MVTSRTLIPTIRQCIVTGLVHVVAYDGIRFCGPYTHDDRPMDRVVDRHTVVTCVSCAVQWRKLAMTP